MKNHYIFYAFLVQLTMCSRQSLMIAQDAANAEYTIAFGSCNKTNVKNVLWDDILDAKPDIWIWGGDNIYADTDDMAKIQTMYAEQNEVNGYKKLKNTVPIMGTWDDHDYGVNDGGNEFEQKDASKQAFLDFMDVPKDSPRREQAGIYTSKDIKLAMGSIKIIILDTRYFRSALTKDPAITKRYKPNQNNQGTILGEEQWQWLQNELNRSKADFNIIVSSIQVLSHEHGFETWGNMPHEVRRLEKLIVDSKAKGIAILSGDRHISEFSRKLIPGLPYPLIDFTSSGLTHSYKLFTDESNTYRVGSVVKKKSFGLVYFDFAKKQLRIQMRGNNNTVLGELVQDY